MDPCGFSRETFCVSVFTFLLSRLSVCVLSILILCTRTFKVETVVAGHDPNSFFFESKVVALGVCRRRLERLCRMLFLAVRKESLSVVEEIWSYFGRM